MPNNYDSRLTLSTLCAGEVQQRVDRALEQVAKNILSPNCEPGKKRSLALKMTFAPDEDDPSEVIVTADVKTQLAPEICAATQLYIQSNGTDITVSEHISGEIMGQISFSDLDPAFEHGAKMLKFRDNEE